MHGGRVGGSQVRTTRARAEYVCVLWRTCRPSSRIPQNLISLCAAALASSATADTSTFNAHSAPHRLTNIMHRSPPHHSPPHHSPPHRSPPRRGALPAALRRGPRLLACCDGAFSQNLWRARRRGLAPHARARVRLLEPLSLSGALRARCTLDTSSEPPLPSAHAVTSPHRRAVCSTRARLTPPLGWDGLTRAGRERRPTCGTCPSSERGVARWRLYVVNQAVIGPRVCAAASRSSSLVTWLEADGRL